MNITISVDVTADKYGAPLESCEITVTAPTLNPNYFKELVTDVVHSCIKKANDKIAEQEKLRAEKSIANPPETKDELPLPGGLEF